MKAIFVNKGNDIIYKGKLCDMSLFEKNNFILFHKSESGNILDDDYNKVESYFKNVVNDLIFLRTYLSQTIRKRGKSLILVETNDPFNIILYKCFKKEYKEKIDFIII